MTILEVLFAIMITTVGLLGAIAVFPVASEYARKGRLNDELAVCAESAAHIMDARGMRRPDHWITYRYVNGTPYFVAGTAGPQNLGGGVVIPAGVNPGESYCLDPRFTAANINGAGVPYCVQDTWFPAFTYRPLAQVSGVNDPDNTGNPGAPRMQRITLVNGAAGGTAPYAPAFFLMQRFQADNVFSFTDQLTYERPGIQKGLTGNDNASPAFQIYSPIKDTANNVIYPGKREDDGKLSWMATLVPKFDRWNGTFEDKYVLSIVVFYGRSPSEQLAIDFNQSPLTRPVNEWTATILGTNVNGVSDFHSSGFGGGEVTISINASDPNASDKLKLRAGDWIMLSGHASYLGGPTVPTFKWYRISDADEDPRVTVFNPNLSYVQRDVTLVGPDWDLQNVLPIGNNPPGDFDNSGNPIWDDVEVTIVPHVVAVFDRTVRLEQDGTGY
jgi:hypothetical protein